MPLTIAIVGRPNVGKSTLFNRLTGKNHALVDDMPGVTRDRREGAASLIDLRFRVIDTPGLEEADDDQLEYRMMQQTAKAVEQADVSLLVVDAKTGITPTDEFFANWLRRKNRPLLLVVNKYEGKQSATAFTEAYSLGLGEPVGISAAHGLGMADLYHAIRPFYKDEEPVENADNYRIATDIDIADQEEEAVVAAQPVDPVLQIAIIGRPNAGKSTLINKLLGEERLLTGPEAGITRDSIAVDWTFEGQQMRLIDTAGIRKRAKISDKLEHMSVEDAKRAVRYAHVVVLLTDANSLLEKQDITLAYHAVEEGRALVVAVNKWDTVEQPDAYLKELRYVIEETFPSIKGVPVVTLSALTGYHTHDLIRAACNIYKVWNRYIGTSKLNHWLRTVTDHHPPPLAANRRPIKLKYITQTKIRPPTFTLFANRPEDLPESYTRYLVNNLREVFDLPGIPLRLLLRKVKNPYGGKK